MTDYKLLVGQAKEMLEAEPWYASSFSNISALIMTMMENLNWAGFYFVRDGGLTVGPFQGKPACIHIGSGKGVCGTAVARDETVLVPDVHQFPGHIACSSASQSEIVVPLFRNNEVFAILDIDSAALNTFDAIDRRYLEQIAVLYDAF